MKYNTTIFKNISEEKFFGKYDGVDFPVEPGEKKYWPTHLSQHCANQLADVLIGEKDNDGTLIHGDKTMIKAKILGETIMTATPDTPRTFREEVAEHELAYAEMTKTKEKEDILVVEKASNIADKNV